MFVNLAARASQSTSEVLVLVGDADVFLVFLHHVHHLCEVVMKLSAKGRNNSRCINMCQPANKIGPQESGISIFAVVLFRIAQRLLITRAVPISILGMPSSCSLPYVHWLWLYDNPQPERRGEAFPADHLDAFVHLSETELLQGFVYCKLEQLTCILYSSKETRVNDARLQTPLSKMPKKGPKMSQHAKTFDPGIRHNTVDIVCTLTTNT